MPHQNYNQIARFFCVALGALCFVSALTARADTAPITFDPLVRVHLARLFDGSESLTFSNTTNVAAAFTESLHAPAPAFKEDIAAGRAVTIEGLPSSAPAPHRTGVFVDNLCSLSPGQSVTLTPPDIAADQVFTIARGDAKPRRYRGSLRVLDLPNGTLRVVNSLLLEDYLKGVVGPEIGSSVPLEALEAQAVAARTYAVKNFGKCVGDGGDADLDDTTRCQSYMGYDAENWRCRTAVAQTAGKIITYDDNPIDAVYSTDCGGETGEGDVPYLKPVTDDDCGSEVSWTLSVTLGDLASELAKVGIHTPASISSLSISGKDDSGRITSLTISDDADNQHIVVSGIRLREALGYDRLRSTLFTLKSDPASHSCVFTGRGWGHGLGMCQRGAVEMAKTRGASYNQILKHYYTGVEITDLTSDFLQEDSDSSRDVADEPDSLQGWVPSKSSKSP